MKSIYNYNSNITVTTTATGDKVITMNKEILTTILNHIAEAGYSYNNKNFNALGDDTMELWQTILDKSRESEPKVHSDYSAIEWAIYRHDNLTDAERDLLIEKLKEDK